MHRVTVDKEKNRLYLTLGKMESADEIMQVVEEIKTACQDLKPGFSCLNDLRDYELIDKTMEPSIKDAQKFLVNAGLIRTVRVVRKFGTWGHLQFDKASMDVGYHAQNVNSIEEALAMLDGDSR
jgi:hypothetical protein